MKDVTVNVSGDVAQAVSLTAEELAAQVRLMAALKMFELGKLSSGHAAELAGLSRVEFLEMCGRYKVSVFNYAADEVADELAADVNTIREASSGQ